jgi:hypothetical protein
MFDAQDFWIVLTLVGGLVVALALLLGRGLRVRRGAKGMSLEVEAHSEQPTQGLDVAANTPIMRSTVGDISGIKHEGGAMEPEAAREIRVLHNGRILDSHTGDISGIKKTRPVGGDE